VTREHAHLVVAALAVVVIAAVGAYLVTRPTAPGAVRAAGPLASPSHRACAPVPHPRWFGLAAVKPEQAATVSARLGARPAAVEYYTAFGARFSPALAQAAERAGALPVVQVNFFHTSLAEVAAGAYDSYIRAYARQVRVFACPVVLSYGHEMNGAWYPWGCTHTPAHVFVRAWRRIVTVARQAGAGNAIWMWTTNRRPHPGCQLGGRWPGGAYVDWVGVDGYLREPGATFATLIRPTLRQAARQFGKPLLLTETGVLVKTPGAAGRVRDLFGGAARFPHLMGLVYFDGATAKFGDYRPQGAAVMAAFRRGVARMRSAR
jgi:mannan endo-1,4-beta-mannosidase